jgi:hypothetical protein
MNTTQIIQAINDLILTGGRRTTAANVRSLLNDFVTSYPNINDGGNVFVVPVGYTSDLTITDDFSFVHKKWVLDNAGGGAGTLSETLAGGNITDGHNIILSGFDFLTGADTDFSLGFNNGSNFFVSYENGATSIYHSITASKNQLGWTDGVETSGIVLTSGSSNFFHDTELYLNSPYITIGDNAGGMGVIRSHVPGETELWFGVDGNQFLVSTDGNTLAESYIQLRPSSMGLGYSTDTSLSLDATDVYLGFASDHYLEITLTTAQLFWNSQGLAINTSVAEINHLTEINFNAPNTRFQQLTASSVPYLDASNYLVSSIITPTELEYLTGATSSIQAQIDALTVGLSWKTAVTGATISALPSYTVSGGNKILTATSNGAFPTTDGVTYTVNQSILIKDEVGVNEPNNGIYTITQVGTGGTPWILTRRNDANTGPLLVSATVSISEGTTLQDKQFVCATDAPISLGVTNISFVAVGGTTYVGTTNRITVTGNVIDISSTFEALLGKVANPLSQFASTTSAQFASIISDETGTDKVVFSDSPTFSGAPSLPTATTAITQSQNDNSTKIATTAYVDSAIVDIDFTFVASFKSLYNY